MDTQRNVGHMRKRMGILFSRIRKRFRQSINAIDLCSVNPSTEDFDVEKIDKNMQTYLHGIIGDQFNFKTIKSDASISKNASSAANSNNDCQDNSSTGRSYPSNERETEILHRKLAPVKKKTDRNPRKSVNGQGDNDCERCVKEELQNFDAIHEISTNENLENHTETEFESSNPIPVNTRQRTTSSRIAGLLSRLKPRSRYFEEMSSSPLPKQKKKTRSVGTSPRVTYGDKATQTIETYTPDELITYNKRGEVTYIKSRVHTVNPIRQLKCPHSPIYSKPGFIEPDPKVQNVQQKNESVRTRNSVTNKQTEHQKQPRVPYSRENDFRMRMLKAIGEPDTVQILEKLHKNCTKHSGGGALVNVIDTAVNQFKRHYEKFSEEERGNVATHEENFILNLKTEIQRLGRVVSNDITGVQISLNAPKCPSEDTKEQGPDKKQRKRAKSRKRVPKSLDGKISGETAETRGQENTGASSQKATKEDNDNIPGAAKQCYDVNAVIKSETNTTQAANLSNVDEFEENDNVYTYDEDNNVWNPENRKRMNWQKKQITAPSAVVSGAASSSTIPYMDISEGFDRGSQYRMDEQQVVGKCRRGFKTETRPQKVKRRGIPNKHLTSANAYLHEDAADADMHFIDESNNSGPEIEPNEEIVMTEPLDVENKAAEDSQQEEVMSEIKTELPEEEDNRHLVFQPSNVFLRKKSDCEDLQEKYSVAKTSKSKGNKQRKKRNATRKVNLIAVNMNNNADDDMSNDDDEEDDDDDDDRDDIFYDDTYPLLDRQSDDDSQFQLD